MAVVTKLVGVMMVMAIGCPQAEEPSRNATTKPQRKIHLSWVEVREYCCSFPPDPAVEERIGNRIMCGPPPVKRRQFSNSGANEDEP
ncbi:Protein of unknown function [Gryllus bimaculatus]|nr:Protein of unknown function [Gryllus bimaculatus]